MNQPVGQGGLPANILKIQGDPTSWTLRTAPPPDPGWHAPVALDITAPLPGTLILSPARVGSFALTPGIFANGWHPDPVINLVSPYLYIPTTGGVTAASYGYPLAADTDLPGLRQRIIDAMTVGITFLVSVNVLGAGVVSLNGAQLPFAVIAEVQTS